MRDEGSRRYLKSEIAHLINENERLREALRPVPLLVEAAKGILNVHTWRGVKGYNAALKEGITELRAAVDGVPDTVEMLLGAEWAALTPKGSQK